MSSILAPRRLLHRMRATWAAGSTTATNDLLSIFSATEDLGNMSGPQSQEPRQHSGTQDQQQTKRRLAAANPVQHGMGDVNSFHVVDTRDEALVRDIFLKRRRRQEVQQQGFCSFMLRAHTMAVANLLDTQEASTALPRVFLTGKDGHGKSNALAYLSYRYWKKGWVVLPVSSGARWVLQPNYIDMSTWRPGRVDSTKDAIDWLNCFYKLNDDRLPQLVTSKECKWLEGSYTTPPGTPIKDLLGLIEEDDRSSTDIVAVLLKELLSSENRPNVLLAVDDVNGLFEPTTPLVDENLQPVSPENMSLVRAFRKVYRNHHALDRVAIVSATTTYSGVLAELNDEMRSMLQSCKPLRVDAKEQAPSVDATTSGAADASAAEDTVDRLVDSTTMAAASASPNYKISFGIASDAEISAFLDYHNSIGWCNLPSNAKTAKVLQSLSAGKLSLLSNQLRAS